MLKETTANSSLYFNLLQNVGVSLCSTSQKLRNWSYSFNTTCSCDDRSI